MGFALDLGVAPSCKRLELPEQPAALAVTAQGVVLEDEERLFPGGDPVGEEDEREAVGLDEP